MLQLLKKPRLNAPVLKSQAYPETANMSSLAVLPPLSRTITDLMDDDLYQAPPSPQAAELGSPVAAATLSTLLNVPELFVEHFNRMTLAPVPSLFDDDRLERPEPVQSIRPELTLRSRLTTLEPPETKKDDDFVFDELQVYFNDDLYPESVVVMKEEEPAMDEHLAVGEFEEDESDYLDDDNYFQDDFEDLDDIMMPECKFQQPLARTLDVSPLEVSPLDAQFDLMPRLDVGPLLALIPDIAQLEVPTISPLQIDLMPFGYTSDADAMAVDDSSLFQYAAKAEHTSPEYEPLAPREEHETEVNECDLINTATGEPCGKKFSRSYDLIRHQETIHAVNKKVFRCVICEGRHGGGEGNGRLKTFSRGDALLRHIKVKHGLGGPEAAQLMSQAKRNVEYILASS